MLLKRTFITIIIIIIIINILKVDYIFSRSFDE